ncbi:MAG: SAM-dependent methyltransferase [Rhodobacterales bacterium]
MQTPKQLFDPNALALHRVRALKSTQKAWFLHEHAADCVHERLQEVNRSFTKPAFIGWTPEIWLESLNSSTKTTPDAEILDLKQSAHDLIINGLTLHWANDPVGQLVQMRRALVPDGLMIAAMFGGQTLHELRTAFAEAEARVEGGISPRISPMAEIRDLGGLLQRAGFALPVADSLKLSVEYETPIHLMNDLRHMGESNAVFTRRRSLKRETLAMAAEIYSANYTKSSGRIEATFELVFLTGWAPSENQQKPLRPGSAQQRLADALGTAEYNPEKIGK